MSTITTYDGNMSRLPRLPEHNRHAWRVAVQAHRRQQILFRWLCLLFISVAYQKPLAYITPYDRTNPRLSDIVFLTGLFLLASRLPTRRPLPSFFKVYRVIIACFALCALIYGIGILDRNMGKFSLWFAARDLQSLLVLYIALRIPLSADNKKTLRYILVGMGVFTTLYCIPQYLNPIRSVEIQPGVRVTVSSGILIGPFSGASYFNLAMFSSLYAVLTLSFIGAARTTSRKLLVLCLAGFVALPAAFSGSRSGLGYLVLSTAFFVLIYAFTRKSLTERLSIPLLACVAALGVGYLATNMNNKTIERLAAFEDSSNSMESRFTIIERFSEYNYKYASLVPFIGAGYGVAPTSDGISERYRVGYGFHNSFLKNYEQGGLVPFFLFFVFLWLCFRSLIRSIKAPDPRDAAFATAVLAFYGASVVVSLVGVAPWYGHGGVFFLFLIHLASLHGEAGIGDASRRHRSSIPRLYKRPWDWGVSGTFRPCTAHPAVRGTLHE